MPIRREVALVGDDEDDPLVGVLQDVGVLALVEPRHDDVAALDQPHAFAGLDRPSPSRSTLSTQGPAALTRMRARDRLARGRRSGSSVAVQAPASAPAETKRVRVRIAAPRSAASSAFSTTRRQSSTQQSE